MQRQNVTQCAAALEARIAPYVAAALATDDVVDAVALVPGAEPEVFEGVGDGSELMLGPGTTVRKVSRLFAILQRRSS